jgi:hypothetical protein
LGQDLIQGEFNAIMEKIGLMEKSVQSWCC